MPSQDPVTSITGGRESGHSDPFARGRKSGHSGQWPASAWRAWEVTPMSNDKRDILEILKFELNFLEQGGYGRSVRTPWKPTSSISGFPDLPELQ